MKGPIRGLSSYTRRVEHTPEYKETIGACSECGNSPTQHLVQYCIATVDVWSSRLSYRGEKYAPVRLLFRLAGYIGEVVERFNHRLFRALRLIRSGHEVEKARTYRSQVVWEEAKRRGITMEQLVFLGSHSDVYRAQVGDTWIYFESLPIPKYYSYDAYRWMDDKYRLNEHLRAAGVPVPFITSVTNEWQALEAFKHTEGRAVAKPRAGSRGRHTTTNIRDEDALRAAFKSAQKLCRHVCITRHLDGSICRGTLVAGKLAGFFQADPPRLVGDGVSTVDELVAKKNQARHDRVQPIEIRDEHDAYLRRAGYTRRSVLPEGEVFDLTHRSGRLFGGETRELLTSVHPKLREYLERAGAALAVPIVGFDLIIKDPEADPDTQEWGIIEANSLPFIDLHYLPLHGEPSNVAAHVWDLWNTKGPADAGPRKGRIYARLFTTFSKTAG
jgi:cyanophycin synthetase